MKKYLTDYDTMMMEIEYGAIFLISNLVFIRNQMDLRFKH